MTNEQQPAAQEPYAWTISGGMTMFRGKYAQEVALEEARHCGGTATAVALYTHPAPQQAAPAEGDALDAERYRWLRDGCNSKDSKATRIVTRCYGLEWDKAIDAAMAAQNGGA